ncbi:putative small RNA 2'-O-methyltransferase Hen1, La-motif domain-containing protein [Helianthus anomalus]
MSIIWDAATRLSEPVLISNEFMSLKRTSPYPPDILESIEVDFDQKTYVKVLRMPYLVEKVVEPLTLDVSANTYYMDAIARELGAADASMVSLSRCIGKSSSETRLYSHAPNSYKWDNENFKDGSYLNARASYLSGQDVYGDVILATIGYLWKSCDVFLEDVSPRTYYRFLFPMQIISLKYIGHLVRYRCKISVPILSAILTDIGPIYQWFSRYQYLSSYSTIRLSSYCCY